MIGPICINCCDGMKWTGDKLFTKDDPRLNLKGLRLGYHMYTCKCGIDMHWYPKEKVVWFYHGSRYTRRKSV